MNWNTLLFLVFPYVALVLAVVSTVIRMRRQPVSVTALSSQLLEDRLLYYGSLAFHWGIVIILAGHLLAMFIPQSLLAWNASPARLYALEITGLALGLWTAAGLVILVVRRLTVPRVRVVTTPMDLVVMALLLLAVVTGILTAALYRYGSYWFPSVFTPYLWSILLLRPRPELVADLPALIQLHVLSFLLLVVVFPFTRLVHLITVPLTYLGRPWQIVIWDRHPRPAGQQATAPTRRVQAAP